VPDPKTDEILKRICVNKEKWMAKPCLHTEAWHRAILPGNVKVEYLRAIPPGESRHPNCGCRGFRAS
jgi:hypothetical protein